MTCFDAYCFTIHQSAVYGKFLKAAQFILNFTSELYQKIYASI